MTPEMGWRSAVAFPRRSALTILRSASFRIRRPIAIPWPRPVDLFASPSAAAALSRLRFLPRVAGGAREREAEARRGRALGVGLGLGWRSVLAHIAQINCRFNWAGTVKREL